MPCNSARRSDADPVVTGGFLRVFHASPRYPFGEMEASDILNSGQCTLCVSMKANDWPSVGLQRARGVYPSCNAACLRGGLNGLGNGDDNVRAAVGDAARLPRVDFELICIKSGRLLYPDDATT